jgi:adenosylcobinamide-GDP ribazoletransferase
MDHAPTRYIADILTGAALLTRLPLPEHTSRGAASAWAWPVVGLILGAIAGLTGWLALWLGLPPSIAALLVLTAQVFASGGLHEDGLADTADGLWGGWTRERRLEIMRDSRIGSYGVIALILGYAARWSALSLLLEGGAYGAALIAAAAMSRGVLPGVMALVTPARADGLSRSTGRPSVATAGVAAALALLIGVITLGGGVIWAALLALAVTIGLARIAVARIGGQTGDILGATQQVVEIAVLISLL